MNNASERPHLKCVGCGYLLFDWQSRCPECGGRFVTPPRQLRPWSAAIAWERSPHGLRTWLATAWRILSVAEYPNSLDLDHPPRHAKSFHRWGIALYLTLVLLFAVLPVGGELSALRETAKAAGCNPYQFQGIVVLSGYSNWASSSIDWGDALRNVAVFLLLMALHGSLWFELGVPILAASRGMAIRRPDERLWMRPILRNAASYSAMAASVWLWIWLLGLLAVVSFLAALAPPLWSFLGFVWGIELVIVIVGVPIASLIAANAAMQAVLARLQPSVFVTAE